MVDIPNHEDALRELSKCSLVNNVTVILTWSAAEAARYLELYKSYEHASFGAIKGQQATGYAERLVEFVTVPRTVNKADAVALVSTFGSLRHAVNATPEQVGVVGGWGEKKVRAWCRAVEEPFRVRKRAGRKAGDKGHGVVGRVGSQAAAANGPLSSRGETRDEDVEVLAAAAEAEAEVVAERGQRYESSSTAAASTARKDDQLSDGVAAALARLREKG